MLGLLLSQINKIYKKLLKNGSNVRGKTKKKKQTHLNWFTRAAVTESPRLGLKQQMFTVLHSGVQVWAGPVTAEASLLGVWMPSLAVSSCGRSSVRVSVLLAHEDPTQMGLGPPSDLS